MWNVWQDARHGLRLLRREPGFALVAILTIALGVGATTTLFSVANGVLLKPLSWPESDRLVRVTETRKGQAGRIKGTITNGTFLAWSEGASTIEGIAGYYGGNTATASRQNGEPSRIQFGRVTPALFSILRVRPLRGRVFAPEDAPAGFNDPSNVLTARVDLPAQYDAARHVAFADAVVERLRSNPAVTSAAAGNALPFVSIGGSSGFDMRSPRDPAVETAVQTMTRIVGSDYFKTLRLRIVEGRALTDADTMESRPVVVVNRTFAKRYLGEPPLGTRVPMSFGEGRPDCDVVGIVDDMRQSDVTEPLTPELFASYRPMPSRLMSAPLILVLRSAGEPMAMVPALRAAVREQDPEVVVDSVMTWTRA